MTLWIDSRFGWALRIVFLCRPKFLAHHIDLEIHVPGFVHWRLTGFYGEPNRSRRHTTWNLLRELADFSPLPWCILGDFNNITTHDDKKGGRPYPQSLIHGFNTALHDCRLCELQLRGHKYTWERGKGTQNHIEIRLDKAFATQSWLTIFNEARLSNYDFSSSDHTPIFLEPAPCVMSKPVVIFRYENAWSREPLCSEIVRSCWELNATLSLAEKTKLFLDILLEWGRDLTGQFKKRLATSKKKLSCLKSRDNPDSHEDFLIEQCNYFEILAQQELYWKQRSKQFWLNGGDKNSKYFHATASSRKRNNQIVQLQDSHGVWKGWDSGLDQVIIDYFSVLYSTDHAICGSVVNGIQRTVTVEQNDALLCPITPEEVKQALFQMHPDKAPGPDGMSPGFYQKHWDIVGADLVKLVIEFFNNECMPPGLNDTHLVLIPKKKNFSSMGDLRPIALCNVSYKILSKVLANRMRVVIDHIISPTQSAFIPGRLISDNILIAFEIMHYLKRKTKGKKGFMAMKLDMSKAYDRVEWEYLSAVMHRMGFASKWVSLIMKCVTSVQYSVFHDGHLMGPIVPSRGIRQGDPLSTYLFIICAEGFSSLIRKFEEDQVIQGCRVARNAPPITHMLFADDSYLFCQANPTTANNIKQMLHSFEIASGQKVNVAKSSIFFSPNNATPQRNEICNVLGMTEATDGSLYLGLPNIIGRKKTVILGFLKNKIINRLNSWNGKFLSRAGKEVLLKSVIQSLPTYAMSVFLLPLETCHEIEKLMDNFWWKTSSAKGQGIIWMSWDRMAIPKHSGGMGFCHLHDFNLAMLAKQGWRFLVSPTSLASRVFQAKYYPNSDFLSAELGNNPSFVWRSIWSAQSLVKLGCQRTIGNGMSTSILKHPWLPDPVNPFVTSNALGLTNHMVNSLMDTHETSWDIPLVQDMFNSRDAHLILGIPLSATPIEDCWSWRGERSGSFSVRSAYDLLQISTYGQQNQPNSGFWHRFWHLKIPPKVKNFMWRAITNTLLTCLELASRNVDLSSLCPVCHNAGETASHVLLNCSFAFSCWERCGFTIQSDTSSTIGYWLESTFALYGDDIACRAIMICWALWKSRNKLVWEKKTSAPTQVIHSAWTTLDHWRTAQDKTSLLSLSLLQHDNNIERWTKPDSDTVKLNVDGALFERESAYGFGIVARDSTGHIVDLRATYQGGNYPAEVVEALGIKEALSWLKDKGWNKVDMETDSMVTVQAIFSNQIMSSTFGLVIRDCKSLLSALNNVSIRFVRRSANRVAHFVARRSRFFSDRSIHRIDFLDELLALMYDEC
ncbi:hypothetical protein CsatB_014242 [Cannabis sativa]